MITGIDHITIGVADLDEGSARYRRLGFNVQPGGVHAGRGTHNALAWNNADYIELLAVRDEGEYRAASSTGGAFARFIAAGGGIYTIVLASDDLAADVAAMRARRRDQRSRRWRAHHARGQSTALALRRAGG